MTRIRTLFLLLTIIGPMHMGEQLLTRIDEFYSIRELLPSYYAWFDPAAADHATVLLITIVWTVVSVLFYTLLHVRHQTYSPAHSAVNRSPSSGALSCDRYRSPRICPVRAERPTYLQTPAGTPSSNQ